MSFRLFRTKDAEIIAAVILYTEHTRERTFSRQTRFPRGRGRRDTIISLKYNIRRIGDIIATCQRAFTSAVVKLISTRLLRRTAI